MFSSISNDLHINVSTKHQIESVSGTMYYIVLHGNTNFWKYQ